MKNRRAIAQMSGGTIPDGLCVDEAGCIWVAVYGGRCAARYTPEGEVGQQSRGARKSSHQCLFRGKDRRDLYIVTADNTEVPGTQRHDLPHARGDPGLAAPLARV